MRLLGKWSSAALVVALLASACASSAPVTVGSYDFVESQFIAEIYAQVLEGEGIAVERTAPFSTRGELLEAMADGTVDFAPEYLGSLADRLGSQPTTDAEQTADIIEGLALEAGFSLLPPTHLEAQPVVVILRPTADTLELETISDLLPYAESFVFGGRSDCSANEQCLLGLSRTYGMTFRSFVPLDSGGPLTAEALNQRTINVSILFNTDSALASPNLATLEDDKGLFPTEALVAIVGPGVSDEFRGALTRALRTLSIEDLRRTVLRIEQGAISVEDAAREYVINL